MDLTVDGVSEEAPERTTASAQGAGTWLGSVDTAVVASSIDALREDLAAHVKADKSGLRLASLTVKLTLSAEGKVAFVAKGSAEACIEVVFSMATKG